MMLFRGNRKFLICLVFCLVAVTIGGSVHNQPKSGKMAKRDLAQVVLNLLSKLEHIAVLSKEIIFAALLSEFLIKQKVRFYESTRYEEQLYYGILHKLTTVIQRADNNNEGFVIKSILANVFQKNVLLYPITLTRDQIDVHREYKSFAKEYPTLVNTGFPNDTLSDYCIEAIASVDRCADLPADCLNIITSDLPNFGYQRMHQVLLLYILMHHKCALNYGSKTAYNIMASGRCTQVLRECNVIEKYFGLPTQYKDLFLEQNTICGLFGFSEFINWRNVEKIMSWRNLDGCYCSTGSIEQQASYNCSCNNHLTSLALVYYVNALLLLD